MRQDMSFADKVSEVVGSIAGGGAGIHCIIKNYSIINDLHTLFMACVVALCTGIFGFVGTQVAMYFWHKIKRIK